MIGVEDTVCVSRTTGFIPFKFGLAGSLQLMKTLTREISKDER